MIFQALDDKTECVGVYAQGELFFEDMPSPLTQTWRHSPSLEGHQIESAWLYCGGQSLHEVCPDHLQERWEKIERKMRAFKKSFDIARLDLRHHCFFDLVPHDALLEFCEVKNRIVEHVFEDYARPSNYEYLSAADRLISKIKYQNLKIDNSDCRSLFTRSTLRESSRKILAGPQYIDYNLFGTVTGRLSTNPGSFPILTMKKELRQLIKPANSWFLSLDYNGAEVRTLLALSEQRQPTGDIHEWNIQHVFENSGMPREEAKTLFFAWLYNPDSDQIKTTYYDRQKVLDRYYNGGYINTVFGRTIPVDAWKAFNYLIQSTTADLVMERAIAIDKFIADKKSFISHIVHDEIVIDFADEDRDIANEIKDIFSTNKLDTFLVNLQAGPDYYNLKTLSL